MRDIPLLRVGLAMAALVALVAVGSILLYGPVGVGDPGSTTRPVPASASAPLGVADHWRVLAPTLAALGRALRLEDGGDRRDSLKVVEAALKRAEETAPAGAGEYREALRGLRLAVDDAGERGGRQKEERALRDVEVARARLAAAAEGAR